MQNSTLCIIFFLKSYTFKNPTNDWPRAFWLLTWELELCQIRGLQWYIDDNVTFHFRLFPEKLKWKCFQKCKKHHVLNSVFLFISKTEFFNFDEVLLCQNLKRTNERIPGSVAKYEFIRPNRQELFLDRISLYNCSLYSNF